MSERKVRREDPARHATDAEVLAASRKLTRRSFAVAAIGAAAGFGLYRWVDYSRDDGMQPVPLRLTASFRAMPTWKHRTGTTTLATIWRSAVIRRPCSLPGWQEGR
jgi:hypothetical protein